MASVMQKMEPLYACLGDARKFITRWYSIDDPPRLNDMFEVMEYISTSNTKSSIISEINRNANKILASQRNGNIDNATGNASITSIDTADQPQLSRQIPATTTAEEVNALDESNSITTSAVSSHKPSTPLKTASSTTSNTPSDPTARTTESTASQSRTTVKLEFDLIFELVFAFFNLLEFMNLYNPSPAIIRLFPRVSLHIKKLREEIFKGNSHILKTFKLIGENGQPFTFQGISIGRIFLDKKHTRWIVVVDCAYQYLFALRTELTPKQEMRQMYVKSDWDYEAYFEGWLKLPRHTLIPAFGEAEVVYLGKFGVLGKVDLKPILLDTVTKWTTSAPCIEELHTGNNVQELFRAMNIM